MAGSVRSVYRALLKAVDRNLTSVAGNTQWREAVAAGFRQNAGLTDPVRVQEELQLAHDYQHLIDNIVQHKALLLSYNIGLSEEERNKQMVEAASKRVGLQLPSRPGL